MSKRRSEEESQMKAMTVSAAVTKDLTQVKRLRATMTDTSTDISTIEALVGVTEVVELSSEEVTAKIEDLILNVITQILQSGEFEFSIPTRSGSNQLYLEEFDRNVLGDKISKRLFLNTAHVRKTAITTRVIQLIHEVCSVLIYFPIS